MADNFSEVIHSHIWSEIEEPHNPFAAMTCVCHGYDVYGDLLDKATYIEYLYLLFKGQKPEKKLALMMERVAIAIANPGPRDPSVHAAMAAGATGATAASSLIAALAVGAGSYGGAREIFYIVQAWESRVRDLDKWRFDLEKGITDDRQGIWPIPEHHVGFDPYGKICATPVRQTLEQLVAICPGKNLEWLCQRRQILEEIVGYPLSMTGVIGAAFFDMGLSPNEAEMLTLLFRLPGAAAHALEQSGYGFRKFPFFSLELKNGENKSV